MSAVMDSPKPNRPSLPEAISHLLSEHHRWLSSDGRFGKRLDQEELCFVGFNLDGVDFSHARLAYAYFEGGSLKQSRFIGAYLHSATFNGCDIEQANFTNADLQWATFNANHEQACFDSANLYKTAWTMEEGAENDGVYAITLLTTTPGVS